MNISIINVSKENMMNSDSKYNGIEWPLYISMYEKARNEKHTYFRKFPLLPLEHLFNLSEWLSAVPLAGMYF